VLRILRVLLVIVSVSCLSGCEMLVASMIPESAYVQPASVSKLIAAPSGEKAMKAAIAAATLNNWTPKTISAETGFLFAEREIRVVARSDRSDSYKLEVNLPTDGKGEVIAKVTPPPGVMGGESTESMVSQYLGALEASLRY
jgi:hypothetical protein